MQIIRCSILLICVAFTIELSAQISHDLEIYSEDELKFILSINGREMNTEPVSNIQILNTDKDYVHAKIKFEDAELDMIERKNLQIAGQDQAVNKAPVSVVYKIVENKKGKLKLKFASRSNKKIQSRDVIIFEPNPEPVNGKIVVNW